VYAGFTSKINLLKHVVDTAIVGDADAVPLHQRPSMRAVHDAPTADNAYQRLAYTYVEVAERAYGIYAVVHGAADADPDIAELERQRSQAVRMDCHGRGDPRESQPRPGSASHQSRLIARHHTRYRRVPRGRPGTRPGFSLASPGRDPAQRRARKIEPR
jgi:hypothetical protein